MVKRPRFFSKPELSNSYLKTVTQKHVLLFGLFFTTIMLVFVVSMGIESTNKYLDNADEYSDGIFNQYTKPVAVNEDEVDETPTPSTKETPKQNSTPPQEEIVETTFPEFNLTINHPKSWQFANGENSSIYLVGDGGFGIRKSDGYIVNIGNSVAGMGGARCEYFKDENKWKFIDGDSAPATGTKCKFDTVNIDGVIFWITGSCTGGGCIKAYISKSSNNELLFLVSGPFTHGDTTPNTERITKLINLNPDLF